MAKSTNSESKPIDSKEKYGIENIIKFFSILYVLLTACGLGYHFFLYKQFGLVITDYLDTSEALLLFVPLITDLPTMFIFLIGSIFFFTKSELFPDSTNVDIIKKGRILRKQLLYLSLILLLFVVVYYVLAEFKIMPYFTSYLVFMTGVVLFGPPSLEMCYRFFEKEKSIKIPIVLREVFYVFIVLLSIAVFKGYSTSKVLPRRAKSVKIEIIFKNGDSTFRSDSSHIFLGRTRNYLFTYDLNHKSASVFNASDIKIFNKSNE